MTSEAGLSGSADFVRRRVLECPLINRLSGYVVGKQPGRSDVIKLNANENPFLPPHTVREALNAVDIDALRFYPSVMADQFRSTAASVHGVEPGTSWPSMAGMSCCDLPSPYSSSLEALRKDDAYVDFVESALRHSLVQLIPEHDNLILRRSLNKGYSLTGIRFGYAIGSAAALIQPILPRRAIATMWRPSLKRRQLAR